MPQPEKSIDPPAAAEFQIQPGTAKGGRLQAWQASHQRKVALRPLAEADAPGSEELRNELDRLTQLHDRHLVEIFGSHVQDGRLHAVSEWTDGEDLETQLRHGHRFTTEEILHIAEGIARGLQAGARQGFLHQDLRPSCVHLEDGGQVKLADIGPLSRAILLAGGSTPIPSAVAYLSPEQGMGQPIDLRSNIYSVGAILYELATGRPPFEGFDSATSLLYQLLHVDPMSPRQAGASIPKELERTILRCLAKMPGDRYSHPAELLDALHQVRDSMSSNRVAVVSQEDDTGDFDIFEDQPLGEGGMGTLLRGRQRSLDRAVAIKIIREAFNANPEFVQRFRREAELLAQVENTNVVQIIGTGVWKGRLFYAMELVRGEDLAARQIRGHRSTPEDILHIAEGVAGALRAAWRYKIVHRDIKPSNIMITPEGTVKVADFGLAKSLRMPDAESRVMAGTPEYLSPEQGLGQKADIRSDLYSLGVVLYELAAGRHPFRGTQSSVAMIYQHVHTEPPSLETLDPGLPAPVRALIHRCLQKRPENRFADPEALLKEVRIARRTLGSLPPEATAGTPAAARGHRRKAVFVAVASLAALAGVGLWMLRPARPGAPDPVLEKKYALAMGLGEYTEAMRLAESSDGRDSASFREAERRDRAFRLQKRESEAIERVAARDWAGAAGAYQEMTSLLIEPDRLQENEAALHFCRSMAEARAKETRGDLSGALQIYTLFLPTVSRHRDYLQDSIHRIRQQLEPAGSRP